MSAERPQGVHLSHALTPRGWKRNLSLMIDGSGRIGALHEDDNPLRLPVCDNPVVPGLTNLHSHAFQYAMAGLTEVRRNPVDSFWSWREMMYFFALTLTPEDMQAIAARLYLDLLKGGYTGIAEFHYVHNDLDGAPYPDPAELSLAIFGAASRTGIGLTHLPVFYARSNFGGAALLPRQRRFATTLDSYAELIGRLRAPAAAGGHRLGMAPHSLRAATTDEIRALMALRDAELPGSPVHIHVAEQMKEVEDSLAWNGRRPIEQLFDIAPVDRGWCLIHATHLTDAELTRVARSGATVGLCPMTEANLGDGIFPAAELVARGGIFGIGSDSNISVSAAQELRQLEYSQRLSRQQRNVLATETHPHVAAALWHMAAAGGARATAGGEAADGEAGLAVGNPASFVELRPSEPVIASGEAPDAMPDAVLDSHVFADRGVHIGDVYVNGARVLTQGRHPAEDAIRADYAAAVARIRTRLADW
ncbi:formimidoylglutamate deiminase [Acidimangrovimonas sediminis]|uniref:formimidoylglutamate deiminase n=1 Tax=Acidimangrovimonas sediminis TaxID=2056283 RepID=UPI000C80510C|nr:formimidoylglutamate deiminase [Acidimangrovimonas sediminis]